jgi:hypothetical protein
MSGGFEGASLEGQHPRKSTSSSRQAGGLRHPSSVRAGSWNMTTPRPKESAVTYWIQGATFLFQLIPRSTSPRSIPSFCMAPDMESPPLRRGVDQFITSLDWHDGFLEFSWSQLRPRPKRQPTLSSEPPPFVIDQHHFSQEPRPDATGQRKSWQGSQSTLCPSVQVVVGITLDAGRAERIRVRTPSVG